jgi:hypothetical protein
MCALLADPEHDPAEIRAAFSRGARLALAGLLAAPALLGAASAVGHPLRTGIDPIYRLCSLAGFAGAGWLAGRSLRRTAPAKAALAVAFALMGLVIAPSFRALQGLTGREPLVAVAAATLPPFTAAFLFIGIVAARVLRVGPLDRAELAILAAGGLAGGAFAMLPFMWAWLHVTVPGGAFVVMTLAVVGFLGCLIAPFTIGGHALDRARERTAVARR